MVRYPNHPLKRLTKADVALPFILALTDTQPRSGIMHLRGLDEITAIIDHHPLQAETGKASFYDVRPDVSVISTMLTEYQRTAGIHFPTTIATALFYGIRTDTLGLSRSASPADIDAYSFLVPQEEINLRFMCVLARSMQKSKVYGCNKLNG